MGFLGKHNVRFKIHRDPEILRRPRCPKCQSIDNSVERSVAIDTPEEPRIQYRKCRACGYNFKTILE